MWLSVALRLRDNLLAAPSYSLIDLLAVKPILRRKPHDMILLRF